MRLKALALILPILMMTGLIHRAEAGTSLELSPVASHIAYKEPELMQEKGLMTGFEGSYTYRDRWFFRAEGRYLSGKVNYSSPISGTLNGIEDILCEARLLAGHDLPIKPFDFDTAAFTGIGYRYLKDAQGGLRTDTGARGYDRESNYVYAPIGIELRKGLSKNWSARITGEVDVFLTGRQINHFDQTGLDLGNFTNEQHTGFGQKISLKLFKDFGKVTVFAGPYFNHWDVRQSKTAETPGGPGALFVEPHNNSSEIGGEIGLKF